MSVRSTIVETFPVRAATPLYGIRPREVGSGAAESLHSFLLTLAYEHSLSANVFVRELLVEASKSSGRAPISTWGWDKWAGASLLSTGELAAQMSAELQHLTGRTEVAFTTLAPLSTHICGQALISSDERVCLQCLNQDIAERRLPYGRLLWRMSAVSCCPVHRTRLADARCGAGTSLSPASHFQRRRLGGSCAQCGSMGFRCISSELVAATPVELWKADQCSRLIEQLSAFQAVSPLVVKDVPRGYCGQTNGLVQLARRADVDKSVLSRWLNAPKARISFGILLAIAASDGFSIAELMQGKIVRARWHPDVHPDRVRRILRRIDHCRVERRMRQALEGKETISGVADDLGISTSSLARHEGLYSQLRDRNQERVLRVRVDAQEAAVADAERAVLSLLGVGRLPTLRNAQQITGDQWLPSQLRAVALIELRRAIGDGRVRAPLKSRNVGSAFMGRVLAAAERVLTAVADPQQRLVL